MLVPLAHKKCNDKIRFSSRKQNYNAKGPATEVTIRQYLVAPSLSVEIVLNLICTAVKISAVLSAGGSTVPILRALGASNTDLFQAYSLYLLISIQSLAALNNSYMVFPVLQRSTNLRRAK